MSRCFGRMFCHFVFLSRTLLLGIVLCRFHVGSNGSRHVIGLGDAETKKENEDRVMNYSGYRRNCRIIKVGAPWANIKDCCLEDSSQLSDSFSISMSNLEPTNPTKATSHTCKSELSSGRMALYCIALYCFILHQMVSRFCGA